MKEKKIMKLNLKAALLAGTAVIALGAGSSSALAQTELTNGVAIVATDAAGVTETDATNTVTVDTSGAAVVLGAPGTNSVIMNIASRTLTMNVSGVTNPLTFADDIVETAGNIAINITDATSVNFLGNVSASPISVGSLVADATTLLTVDTAAAENHTFAATINAADATDTVNLTVTNTDGGANTVTFTGAIGGTTVSNAIDTIAIGADTVDPMDVTFGASVNAGAINIGGGNGANATNNVRFGTAAGTSTVTGQIVGLGAGDTNNVSVVGGSTVTFVTGFGAEIDAINLGADATDTTVTIQGAVASGPITIGAGATADTNTLTLDTTNGAFTVTPAIVGGHANDDNSLLVSGGDVATVTGDVGASSQIDTITLSGTGTGLTLGGTLEAADINIGAGTTLTSGGAVTGDLDFTGGGTLALGHAVTGTIDNTSGTDGVGTLTTSAGTFAVSGIVGGTNTLGSITNSGTGTVTFNAATSATTVTQSGTGEIQFDDTATATTFVVSDAGGVIDFDGAVMGNTRFSADGEVTIADGFDITGTVNNTSGAAGAGTLTVEGTTTVSGNVGASNTLKTITAGAAGKTATFSGTVRAADIDFSGAGDIAFDGNTTVTNDVDMADNAGTVTFGDGANFTGTVQDTSDDKGTATFAGSSTVTGSLGTAGNSLNVVNFNGVAGKAVTVSGGVDVNDDINVGAGSVTISGQVTTVQDVNFTGDGSISFADALVAIGDDVLTGTDSEGTVTFLGDGTVGGDIAADGSELLALILSGTAKTVAVTGAIEAADTTTIGSNILTAGTTVDVDAGQTLGFEITGDTDGENGRIVSAGAATVDATAVVDVTVNTTEFVADATEYTVIDGTGGGGVADLTTTITDDSVFLTFTQKVADDDNLVLVADRTASNTLATGTNNKNVATVLEALGAAGDAGLDGVQGALQGASTVAELDSKLRSLTPTVDGGFVTGGTQASALNIGATNMRLAAARTGEDTGMVAGEMGEGVTTWLKGFGQMADQDRRDGVAGYDADTYGVAVGIDSENILDNSVIGVSLSYANTDVDSKNSNNTETDVDSYQVSVYGSHDYEGRLYVSGVLGYAYNDIDQTRHNVAGIAGNDARADFDSNQYIAYAEVGKDFDAGNRLTLTPKALVNYQHIDIDGYTETGSTANQVVSLDNMDIFEVGLGVKAEWDLEDNSGNSVRPSINAGYRYDLVGDEVQATSRFTGGGASFSTNGADPAQGTFNVGAAVTYDLENNWALTADYEYEGKSDFGAHSASLRAGYKF